MFRPVVALAVLACLLDASASAAEGLHFDGDRLLHDHTFIQLTAAQRREIHDAPNNEIAGHSFKSVVLVLNARQRSAIRRATGETVRWVVARGRAVFEHDCTCGDVNIAVIYPRGRIAVLHDYLDEKAPMPAE
jgi:hypothetical protein